ncbi:hypothetical protein [Rubellimicrobium roseum]|uniref:Uncharacterized protein n=1 Tax=Rubellimicrobium roseum TaxID=687525 RepID=A0A5C4NP54_9RHOB|nr:hypothetical protein [Rubellimicrobium roseum]TNC74169.1 hypothetical protein FHG71_02965 [Rubellimicrobium roseum]
MVGSHDKSDQGPLPGRQTEVPNAGPGFPAEHDLKRAKEVPQSIRERIDETGVTRETPGLKETGDLRGPLGDNQDSRGRGTTQEKDVYQDK